MAQDDSIAPHLHFVSYIFIFSFLTHGKVHAIPKPLRSSGHARDEEATGDLEPDWRAGAIAPPNRGHVSQDESLRRVPGGRDRACYAEIPRPSTVRRT
jgi:hypothetical protein